ncbi:sigma-70 family RNA polymerase sigma factor [Kitasatospora sp. GP82]|uniref:RNA polymerase sigma factor n=1 Tax=Kitasatospora sp. GP82 TaxID=3035089 RepID=UPI002476319E|nr:sigma-70 family RNA polymerase sigma factor [Kitasatospora sp. GP82]MDH6124855.1 RNA polymerase sigma factor (sigma-70 family) [Kitasatospora sp. GP82]
MGHPPTGALGAVGTCVPHLRPPQRPALRGNLTFSAFHEHHCRLWLRYTHTQVGNRAAAQSVVDDACADLLENWDHVLEQESVPGYAWTVLREHVHSWLDKRGIQPALVGTASFQAAIRKLLVHETRDEFAAIESGLGLYSAISGLPDRQYDVIVLRYVLQLSAAETADQLGIEEATVRSHVRHARRALAKELCLPEPPELPAPPDPPDPPDSKE